jgi:hypothetical protein
MRTPYLRADGPRGANVAGPMIPRSALALIAAALLAAGCGGDKESSSKPKAKTTASARTSPPKGGRAGAPPAKKRRRLVPNRRRAAIERTVERFVTSVERSDSASACTLLGRPPGTIEGCAAAAGIDLRMLPSSNELSITHVSLEGRRASAGLSGGQTFTLRRAGSRWLISGLSQ